MAITYVIPYYEHMGLILKKKTMIIIYLMLCQMSHYLLGSKYLGTYILEL